MKFLSVFLRKSCISRAAFLAFLWTLSLICGGCVAANDPSVVVLMRLAPLCQVSIVGLVYVIFLPFLISFISIHRGQTIWIYILLGIKGFLNGYCLSGISLVYGDAGWLMCGLLLFSGFAVNVYLLNLGFGKPIGKHMLFHIDHAIALFVALMIGIVDYFIISPFLMRLLRII